MSNSYQQSGFSAVELLITLFIAAAFLISGYQLYAVVIKDGGEARMQARANNVANDYLQRYRLPAPATCGSETTLFSQNPITPTPSGLSNVAVSVARTCPYGTSSTVSKITSTATYGSPVQTVINATYVTP